MKKLIVWLALLLATAAHGQITSDWERLETLDLQHTPDDGCPNQYLAGTLAVVNGAVHIQGNVNKCQYLWAPLDLVTGQVGLWFDPNPDSFRYTPPGGHMGFNADGCVTLGDRYTVPDSQFGIMCGETPIRVFNGTEEIRPGALAGYMAEIPEEHQERLGGTHMVARGIGSTRFQSGSTMGPGGVVVDLSTIQPEVPGYKLFWSEQNLITPRIDDEWDRVTRVTDDRVSDCTFMGDRIFCVGSSNIGDWYGKDTYCQGSPLPLSECEEGQEPSIHPISGEPMQSLCGGVHRGRRQTDRLSMLWEFNLDGEKVAEEVLYSGVCGGDNRGVVVGITYDEETGILAITERLTKTARILRYLPEDTGMWIEFTLSFRCYMGDQITAYRNDELVADVRCEEGAP
jgi:hypothetical protein